MEAVRGFERCVEVSWRVVEMFEDVEIDMNLMGVTILVVGFFAVFLFIDPFNTGMSNTPLYGRVIATILAVPFGYLIAQKVYDKN